MTLLHVWRLALVMLIMSATFGIGSYLADLLNNPSFPLEASFAFMLIVLLLAGMTTLLTTLFKRWMKGFHAKRNP